MNHGIYLLSMKTQNSGIFQGYVSIKNPIVKVSLLMESFPRWRKRKNHVREKIFKKSFHNPNSHFIGSRLLLNS